mmetsp:Transcript_58845/g.167016  ORF Transcript_58845/g.167016 Transcript_58845/m.167016 type:complete len:253 (-) Transcript_58845:667-1425(-)
MQARLPLTNRLTVKQLALEASRLRRTATMSPEPNFLATVFFCSLPIHRVPSESKHTAWSPSPTSRDAVSIEKPSFSTCRDPTFSLTWGSSAVLVFSITFTSYMYRPDFTPTLARAPASRYCKPPSVSGTRMLPYEEGITFMVVSLVRKVTQPLILGLLSSGESSSASSSFRASGCRALAASSSFCSSSSIGATASSASSSLSFSSSSSACTSPSSCTSSTAAGCIAASSAPRGWSVFSRQVDVRNNSASAFE